MKLSRFAGLISLAMAAVAHAQYIAVDCNPTTGYVGSGFRSYGGGGLVGNLFVDDVNTTQVWGVWSDPFTFQILNDPSVEDLFLGATDGTQHGGWGRLPGFVIHAYVWNGLNTPGIDLHPVGSPYISSEVYGIHSGRQVGYVYESPGPSVSRAALWFGTPESMVLLTPDAPGGEARGAFGNQQVGLFNEIGFGGSNYPRACIWNDTAASMVSLHPLIADTSVGQATDGVQQGGHVTLPATNGYQAAVWQGTAASFVNLHPAGGSYFQSAVLAVANGRQAGFVTDATTFMDHAAVWSGTAGSFIDLHQFLPPGSVRSTAYGIDDQGNVYGFAEVPQGFYTITHAYKWTNLAPPPPQFTMSNFKQPLNDPATPESSFKKNSTINVKFQLLDTNGNPVDGGDATISLFQVGTTNTPVNESDFITPADDGSTFTYDAATSTYIYHLGTKKLSANTRYEVVATVGSVSHSVTFSLR